jgi:anti-anti-sigma factor
VEPSVTTRHDDTVVTVAAAGEIDLSSRAGLDDAIANAISGGTAGSVVVDLSGVTFLDSSGIAVLLRGRNLAGTHGVGFRITGARGIVRDVLDMTGIWALLGPADGTADGTEDRTEDGNQDGTGKPAPGKPDRA